MTKRREARKAPPLCSEAIAGKALNGKGGSAQISWLIPAETPVALQINSAPYAVMMATQHDLHDFGVGFVIAEGIALKRADINGVLVMPVENGFAIDVAINETALDAARIPSRSIEGRSGCGLCGVENIADVLRVTKRVAHTVEPNAAAILKAAAALPARQPMNRVNYTVHGAAWVSLDGAVLIVREDIGRHNALDKLIGALADAGTDLSSGFVLMTSRCSFELVQKAATAGIGALVTVSAPTTLALQIARKAGLFLASLGDLGVVVFSN